MPSARSARHGAVMTHRGGPSCGGNLTSPTSGHGGGVSSAIPELRAAAAGYERRAAGGLENSRGRLRCDRAREACLLVWLGFRTAPFGCSSKPSWQALETVLLQQMLALGPAICAPIASAVLLSATPPRAELGGAEAAKASAWGLALGRGKAAATSSELDRTLEPALIHPETRLELFRSSSEAPGVENCAILCPIGCGAATATRAVSDPAPIVAPHAQGVPTSREAV